MGVDYGTKRIGIAMTDPMKITASPFDTIESSSVKKDALEILKLAEAHDVSVIVFGLPINMNATEGMMADIVRKVIGEIENLCLGSGIEVTAIDERLTTAQTERMLIEEGNMPRRKRRDVRDKVAAALILRTYLDTH
jgi:putative Holliday junction resolvase